MTVYAKDGGMQNLERIHLNGFVPSASFRFLSIGHGMPP